MSPARIVVSGFVLFVLALQAVPGLFRHLSGHVVLSATFVDFERLATRVRGRATIPVLRAA